MPAEKWQEFLRRLGLDGEHPGKEEDAAADG
jgi:hypothetical protein